MGSINTKFKHCVVSHYSRYSVPGIESMPCSTQWPSFMRSRNLKYNQTLKMDVYYPELSQGYASFFFVGDVPSSTVEYRRALSSLCCTGRGAIDKRSDLDGHF